MARVVWTPEAIGTLDAIRAYLSEVAPDHADRMLTAIIAAMNPTLSFPRIGRIVPEFDDETYREMIFESYRVVYSIIGDTIFVLAVLHAATDVAARLRELGLGEP